MTVNDWQKDYPALQYQTEEELDENHSLKKMLRLIGENKRVIDFGCATGYLSHLLTKKGCLVTGIEINSEAAKAAEEFCEQVIVADLDFISLNEVLGEKKFDVAVFGDVLEHLRNPARVLKETHNLLNPEGYVVASIPNIAHGAIRLSLLQGNFEYTELGILDHTHLRFFTRKTIIDLFDSTGYLLDVIDCTKLPVFSNSPLLPHIEKNDFPLEVSAKLEQDEDAEAFQFIVRASPSSIEGRYLALNQRYSHLLNQYEQSQSQLQHAQLELAQSQSQLQHSQAQLEELKSQLQYTQSELEQSKLQLQQTRAELEQFKLQSQSNRVELEQFKLQSQSNQVELEQFKLQSQHTQSELEESKSQLQQTQAELEQSKLQFQQTQAELEQSKNTVVAMKTSKFWKLRHQWFKLKHLLGLSGDE